MTIANTAVASPTRPAGIKIAAALAGALIVAASAQVAIPVPGSLVPFTLQPLAVLIVGGLLGPRYGALSLVMYLAMGAAGLPVFAPLGAPGIARLLGPTGGFLLGFPLAAWAVGAALKRTGGRAVNAAPNELTALPPYRLTALACLLGIAIIFAGGIAQLVIIAPDRVVAMITPFLLADLLKALLAAVVIRRLTPRTAADGHRSCIQQCWQAGRAAGAAGAARAAADPAGRARRARG